MTRSYLGSLGALGAYAIGARFGLAWGFLAGVCLLAGFSCLSLADSAARRVRANSARR